MVVKKNLKSRKESDTRATRGNGHTNGHANGRDITLRNHAEEALHTYFANLNGHRPARLYDLVMREVEEPLFKTVMDYAEGNQCHAAVILGINRGTLRKKLKALGLSR